MSFIAGRVGGVRYAQPRPSSNRTCRFPASGSHADSRLGHSQADQPHLVERLLETLVGRWPVAPLAPASQVIRQPFANIRVDLPTGLGRITQAEIIPSSLKWSRMPLEVCTIHRRISSFQVFLDFLQSDVRRTPRSKSVGTLRKIRFKDRLQNQQCRHLDDPVANRRNAHRSQLPVGFGDIHPLD